MRPYTVLVVAGTPSTCAGLTAMVADASDLEVVSETTDIHSLQAQLDHYTPDVVLVCLDPALDVSGPDVAARIKAHSPETKLLLLSSDQTVDTIVACVAAGADGYLPPDLASEALQEAVRDVCIARNRGSPTIPCIAGIICCNTERRYTPSNSPTMVWREIAPRKSFVGIPTKDCYTCDVVQYGFVLSEEAMPVVREAAAAGPSDAARTRGVGAGRPWG